MEVEAPGKVVEEKDEDGAEVAPTLPEAAVFCEDEITKDWISLKVNLPLLSRIVATRWEVESREGQDGNRQ